MFQLREQALAGSAADKQRKTLDANASADSKASRADSAAKVGDLGSLERFASSDPLLASIVQQKREEDRLRALFVQEPDNEAIRDPHVLLQSLYPTESDAKGSLFLPIGVAFHSSAAGAARLWEQKCEKVAIPHVGKLFTKWKKRVKRVIVPPVRFAGSIAEFLNWFRRTSSLRTGKR